MIQSFLSIFFIQAALFQLQLWDQNDTLETLLCAATFTGYATGELLTQFTSPPPQSSNNFSAHLKCKC